MVWNKIRSNNQKNSKIDAVTIQITGHLPTPPPNKQLTTPSPHKHGHFEGKVPFS